MSLLFCVKEVVYVGWPMSAISDLFILKNKRKEKRKKSTMKRGKDALILVSMGESTFLFIIGTDWLDKT